MELILDRQKVFFRCSFIKMGMVPKNGNGNMKRVMKGQHEM